MTDPSTRSAAASRASVRESVAAVIGAGRVDEVGGCAVARPRSDEEVAGLMRLAAGRGWRVLPSGGGAHASGPTAAVSTEVTVGPSVGPSPDLVVSARDMDELLEHEPGDLVVRARAGLPLSRLQSEVAKAGQWLALDPPGGSGLSVGQLVARGEAGPLRIMYGRPRDQVLGLTLVDGSGRVLRLGGRVVKNVAGFDLVRFVTGSRGALGMITEAVFRLYPLPERDRTLVWERDRLVDAWRLGRQLVTMPLPLAAAELISGAWAPPLDRGDTPTPTAPDNRTCILVRLQGGAAAVQRMDEQLQAHGGGPDRRLEAADSRACWSSLAAGQGSAAPSLRVHTLPARAEGALRTLASMPFERLALHLLEGTLRVVLARRLDGGERRALDAAVREVGGTVRAGRGDGGVAAARHRNAEVESVVALRSRLVRRFDPAAILPGSWREGWLDDAGPGEGVA